MRAQAISGSQTDERVKLEKRFLPLMEERLGMRQLVTYVPNKTVPIHRWFSYKRSGMAFYAHTSNPALLLPMK